MIATSHVIIGGCVGVMVESVTHNPALALTAGIATHYLCDIVPHLDGPINPQLVDGKEDQIVWTKGLYIFAVADSVLAFLLTLFLWHKYFHLAFWAPFAWGALGGYLPDLVDNVPWWRFQIRSLPVFKQIHRFHVAMHDIWRPTFPMDRWWPLGIITQLVTVLPCLWWITR